MLGYWIVTQLIGGFSSLGSTGGGVVFWTRTGGFFQAWRLYFCLKMQRLLATHPYLGLGANSA